MSTITIQTGISFGKELEQKLASVVDLKFVEISEEALDGVLLASFLVYLTTKTVGSLAPVLAEVVKSKKEIIKISYAGRTVECGSVETLDRILKSIAKETSDEG